MEEAKTEKEEKKTWEGMNAKERSLCIEKILEDLYGNNKEQEEENNKK